MRSVRGAGFLGRMITFLKVRILHVNDSPSSLAKGVAVGLFVAWLPAIGIQMLLAFMLAIPLKANKALALGFVWVSNVFTLVPIYLPNYLLGRSIINLVGIEHASSAEQAVALMKKLGSFGMLLDIWTREFWMSFWRVMVNIGFPLWVGSLVVASVIGAAGYFGTYRAIVWYRVKYPRRRYRKHSV